MRPVLGVLADDLTGGMETASMLVAEGVACSFVTAPSHLAGTPPAPALVVAQKTRVIEPEAAVRKSEDAARALLDAGVRQLFFKYCATFDSTDRGNIGPVADRLLALTGAQQTIFCPAAPEAARSVFNGHLFVGTQLVSESPKRHDPLTPMTDPDLVRVLQRQSSLRVGLLVHHVVHQGPDALREEARRLEAGGISHLIADAIYPEDLDAIAAFSVEWRVITGNSPIVRHLPGFWRKKGWLAPAAGRQPLPPVNGAGVVLAGSCAERTLEQLAAFERQRPVYRLDLPACDDPADAVAQAVAWAKGHLESGPVALATSAGPDGVRAAQERFGREGAAARAEHILAELAVRLHALGARRFVVAGGETSGAFVERLGIERLRIGAYEGPGVARATTEDDEPIALCLKSGKLGSADMFLPTLESMKHPEKG